jgi:hypothetical protein
MRIRRSDKGDQTNQSRQCYNMMEGGESRENQLFDFSSGPVSQSGFQSLDYFHADHFVGTI